jgi:hypothetical protein
MNVPMPRFTRAGGRIVVVTLGVAMIACVDWPASPRAVPETSTSDFVAAGMVFNALWQPTPAGLAFRGSASVSLDLSAKHGVITTSTGTATPSAPDTLAAEALRRLIDSETRGSSRPLFSLGGGPTASRLPDVVLKARYVKAQKVDGKDVRLAFAPDPDTHSGRPPRAALTFVNGRIAAVMEIQYAKNGGVWRPVHVRTTLLDNSGKAILVSDENASQLSYTPNTSSLGALDVAGAPRNLAARVTRLFRPDALYAAARPAEEEACWEKAAMAAAANFAVLGAGAKVVAAQAARDIAAAALSTAWGTCAEAPVACVAAIAAASIGLEAAEAALGSAYYTLAAATTAAAAADASLEQCLNNLWKPKPEDRTYEGRSHDEDADCAEWCQWTVHYEDDGSSWVSTDYCWCEDQT